MCLVVFPCSPNERTTRNWDVTISTTQVWVSSRNVVPVDPCAVWQEQPSYLLQVAAIPKSAKAYLELLHAVVTL